MRLYCSGQHVKEVDRCDTLVVWVRCGYALATISVWVRSLQYVIELSEKVGVLVIIFTEMLYEDVSGLVATVLEGSNDKPSAVYELQETRLHLH